MPKVTLDTTVLETLREHAASAARLVGHIDDAVSVAPLADHVDEIFHTLSEILGNPHLVAAPMSSATFTLDVDGVSEHVSPERTLALAGDTTTPREIAALALDASEAAQ